MILPRESLIRRAEIILVGTPAGRRSAQSQYSAPSCSHSQNLGFFAREQMQCGARGDGPRASPFCFVILLGPLLEFIEPKTVVDARLSGLWSRACAHAGIAKTDQMWCRSNAASLLLTRMRTLECRRSKSSPCPFSGPQCPRISPSLPGLACPLLVVPVRVRVCNHLSDSRRKHLLVH
jgi:hypothetical protein